MDWAVIGAAAMGPRFWPVVLVDVQRPRDFRERQAQLSREALQLRSKLRRAAAE